MDFYGYIKWHGKRFCYQEWVIVGKRKYRQRAIVAKPISGTTHKYNAKFFDGPGANTIVTLKPTSCGYFMKTRIPIEDVAYRMRLKETSRSQFVELNGEHSPSWTPCPRF